MIPPQHSRRLALALLLQAPVWAGAATPDEIEWFESRIRPVLAQECYECHHSEGKPKGGLVLDYREGLLEGGASGPAITPGDPAGSLLLRVLRHEIEGAEMPKDGAKLDADTVAAFEKWIAMGAPDPRDHPPTQKELESAMSWDAVREGRKNWWSFQPIREVEPPAGAGTPVDRFLDVALADAGIKKAGLADKRVLLRRVTFTLAGLPPTPEEMEDFLADESDAAFARVVDRLLASPAFGERWGRYWLDWVRYAESHGSEGDPAIPNAHRYRDYVIRAFNADVPYDQLVRESLAGDLLVHPRLNHDLGINESAIGPGQLRMTLHGFAPTDALDELVRFTDNQIDTVTKAFLGVTVSCARCHNHKFDPISQTDYYALFGVFASCRPALVSVGLPQARDEPDQLKAGIRNVVAREWLNQAELLGERLLSPDLAWRGRIEAAKDNGHMLFPWKEFENWEALANGYRESLARLEAQAVGGGSGRWRLGKPEEFAVWSKAGSGIGVEPNQAGDFVIPADGNAAVARIFPAGVISHGYSTKDSAVVSSPRVLVEGKARLFVQVAGDGGAIARYVVRNYPRNGTVYPVSDLNGGKWQWMQWDVSYWDGDEIYFEVTTAADSAVLAKANVERSWFAIREARIVREGEPEPREEWAEWMRPLFKNVTRPVDREEWAACYVRALRECVEAWRDVTMDDSQALFLDHALQAGLVTAEIPEALPLISRYRELEAALPVPIRAPGVVEGDAFDQALFERGDHKRPLEPVRRRFLEAIDPRPFETESSGRRELAESILAHGNPLTARVAVNRLWQGVFGRGLVPTMDNFGRLGEKPSHPELLDFLARQFVGDGWSMRRMIRSLVMTEAFQRDTPKNSEDPTNALLSGYSTRRLDAEAIRDSMLAVSGVLDMEMFGPSVGGESPRRSIYVRAIRNNMDPFLEVFDAPVPFATRGRRDATNVPAQSLTLMNSPQVRKLASAWAGRISGKGDPKAAAARMFEVALGRSATGDEIQAALDFMESGKEGRLVLKRKLAETERRLVETDGEMGRLVSPVYDKLGENGKSAGPAVMPVAWWDFESDLSDKAGAAHGHLRGSARLAGGALILDGNGHMTTDPLGVDLREKTLEAWVMLGTLDQAGGGVLTVQMPEGTDFDSIVYAEREARQWMPGSEYLRRTHQPGGPVENEAVERPVHVAITYAADGTISMYREGNLYGSSYPSEGPYAFGKGNARVLVGCRHGNGEAGRMLQGRVLEARIYDRALSAEEVRASSATLDGHVGLDAVLDELSSAQREKYKSLAARRGELESSLERINGDLASVGSDSWEDLGHALFNLKEFLYVR